MFTSSTKKFCSATTASSSSQLLNKKVTHQKERPSSRGNFTAPFSTKNKHAHNQIDNFISHFHKTSSSSSSPSSFSSSSRSGSSAEGTFPSLISRLKDNILQQRWANSLSLFDNTAVEVKKAKWKPFHFQAILEVNRKHNRSFVCKKEQFEKLWSFLKEHPDQSVDSGTLSEALATACVLRDKELVEEVKKKIADKQISLLGSEDGGAADVKGEIAEGGNDGAGDKIRNFAQRYYERFVESDWQAALSSVEKFLEITSPGAGSRMPPPTSSSSLPSSSNDVVSFQDAAATGNNFNDTDDDEDVQGADADAKLAALEKLSFLKNQKKSSSSSSAMPQPLQARRQLDSIHNILNRCEDPRVLKNTIQLMNMMNEQAEAQATTLLQRAAPSVLPQPTDQTLSYLIQCHGRRGEWEEALEIVSSPSSSSSSSGIFASIPRGPFCYAQALKSLSRQGIHSSNSNSSSNNNLETATDAATATSLSSTKSSCAPEAERFQFLVSLLEKCEEIVSQMRDSQIPHTPQVVEAIVGVFEARANIGAAAAASALENNKNCPSSSSSSPSSTSFAPATADSYAQWKKSAWSEALSYFSAIRMSTNMKGTRHTYESLIRMHEKKGGGGGDSRPNSSSSSSSPSALENIFNAMREDGLQPDEKSQVRLINSWSFKKARDLRRVF